METVIGVVILEDDPMVLELHRQYIGRMKGFKMLGHAADGEAGLRLIGRCRPHLAVVDIYMPGLSGLEILKQTRKQGWNTDVILVTAAHDTDSVQQGIQYGAADYIIKPFTFARFKRALEQYRNYFNKLRAGGKSVSQQDIDTLKATAGLAVRKNALPKGLQRTTLELIVELLSNKSSYFTAPEIATALGISRITVKRYLNFLHDTGYLQESLTYGPVGRPQQKFLVTKGVTS
jgi:Response regulator of citrate/malate metabolism